MKNRQMRVCMLTTSFPRWKEDYAASFVYDLCEKLIENGIYVMVVAPHDIKALRYEKLGETEIFRFVYMRPKKMQKLAYGDGLYNNFRTSFFARFQLFFFTWFFFRRGVGIAKKCDIIHAHWALSGFIGVFIKKLLNKPLIITVHGSDVNYLPKSGLRFRLVKFTLENCEEIITVSNALKNKITGLGVNERKIKLIPNGVDTEIFSPRGEKMVKDYLLWVGRMAEEKGLKYLIEAMVDVVDKKPKVKLMLVGEGDLKEDLEKQAKELGISDHIQFEGKKPHTEISSYMQKAKILVLPSLSEGMPLTLLEAMSCGIPIVGTKIGGISEVVKCSENGFLVPPKNSEELSKAILKLIENETLLDKYGKNARDLILKKYNLNKMTDETIRIYSELEKRSYIGHNVQIFMFWT